MTDKIKHESAGSENVQILEEQAEEITEEIYGTTGVPQDARHLSSKKAKPSRKHILWQYLLLICGSILFPIGVNLFIAPWKFNTGGLIGIAQIASQLISGSMRLSGLFNMMLNIPLFLLAWKSLSRSFLIRTVCSILIQSALLSFLSVPAEPIFADPLTNVIFGAIISGFGIGLCLQSAGSAGGLDILGVWFSVTRPGFSVGRISYIVNAFVEAFAVYIYGTENALYSILFIVIMYFVSDRVHLQNISMSGMIITDNPQLKYILLERIRRGITWWKAKGAYTGKDKEVLLCVMNRYEVRYVKRIIHEADPDAFFIINKTQAVLGNFERRLTE